MKKVLEATVAVAGVAAIAGVVYATYKYFTEGDNPCHRCPCDNDWDDDNDDWDDDFEDDDFFDDVSEEDDVKEEKKESPVSIKVE